VILLLNGAFGIGKTTVARALIARIPGSLLFDPEIIGILLQRSARLFGYPVEDFQDLRAWRRLTVFGLRLARLWSANIVVPMAFSNHAYLQEIRQAIENFEPQLYHFCLVAPTEVLHSRLKRRGADPEKQRWEYRRASECCAAHVSCIFATHLKAVDRTPEELAEHLLHHTRAESSKDTA
jgi:chloramphenicol 3-O-phosphotransferase